MGADELFLKIVDVVTGANDQSGTGSSGASTFKFHTVNRADIVDIDGISVLYGKSRICGVAGAFSCIGSIGILGSCVLGICTAVSRVSSRVFGCVCGAAVGCI